MDALIGRLIGRAWAGLARAWWVGLCAMLAGVAAMSSAGCGLAALWFIVLPHAGPAGAALILAGVLALLFLVLLALTWILVRRNRRLSGFEANAAASALAARQLFTAHKGTMLLAALVAGMNAGAGFGGGNR
jgi:hypothetical protein